MVTLTFLIVLNLIAPSLSADVRCDLAFECANSTTNPKDNRSTIHIRGYKSHTGSLSTLNTGDYIYCSAGFACSDASSITAKDNIFCDGSNACAKSPYIHSNAYIYGLGVNALTSSTISTTLHTYCYGEQSCAYSIIEGSGIIEARGAYSLLNAVIDSAFGGILAIYLYGYYSGFGSDITCRTGDSCTIHCAVNGCTNVHLNCDDNCIINYRSDTVRAINHSWIDIDSILLYDSANITNTLDGECSAQIDTMNYDNYYEALSGDITATSGGPLCCRARRSCYNINNLDYTSPIGETIVAGGYQAISNSTITSNGDIFCDARFSCDRSTINTTGIVYCTAYKACMYAGISATRVYCSSSFGCERSSFLSDGNDMDIYLLGVLSGYYSNIICSASDTCSIWCYGHESCRSMTLVCDGICDLYCDADSLCPDGWNATVERPTTITTAEATEIATLKPSIDSTVLPSDTTSWNVFQTKTLTSTTTEPHTTTISIVKTVTETDITASHPTESRTRNTVIKLITEESSIEPDTTSITDTAAFAETVDIVDTNIINNNDDTADDTLDVGLLCILSGSSIAFLGVIGAVIWYWIQRRKQKELLFKRAQKQISNKNDVEDNDDVKEKDSKSEVSTRIMYDVKDNDDVKEKESKSEASMESLYDVVVDETVGVSTKTPIDHDHDDVIEHVEGDGEQRANIPHQRKESVLDEVEGKVKPYNTVAPRREIYDTTNDGHKPTEHVYHTNAHFDV